MPPLQQDLRVTTCSVPQWGTKIKEDLLNKVAPNQETCNILWVMSGGEFQMVLK